MIAYLSYTKLYIKTNKMNKKLFEKKYSGIEE